MPRKTFANPEDEFDYLLMRIARDDHKDSSSNAKIRIMALIEWAERRGIKTKRIKKEDFEEELGVRPSTPEPQAVEQKPAVNVMDELEGRK